MSIRRHPLADDLVEEDTGTDRMLKEENALLRHSAKRRSLRCTSATFSMYSEKPKLWTLKDEGHEVNCAKLTASSILEKDSPFWSSIAALQKLEVEDGKEFFKALAKRFSEMVKLETLSIIWTEMKSLPAIITKLTLRTLVLQHNNLSSVNGVELLTGLEVLDLTSNKLKELPKAIGNLEKLRILVICGNKMRHLPDGFERLQNLESFNCSSNRLATLPDSLTLIQKLSDLDISSNHLEQLPENFGNLSGLMDLRASGNQLNCLPKSFAKLNRLVSLLLGNNRFLFVPAELGALERLENLNLRNNHISSVESALSSVRCLVLDTNRMATICEGICHSTNLELLSMAKNLLKTVPEDILHLKRLRCLQLSGNPLSEVPENVIVTLKERQVKVRMLGTNYEKPKDEPVAEIEPSDQFAFGFDLQGSLPPSPMLPEHPESSGSGETQGASITSCSNAAEHNDSSPAKSEQQPATDQAPSHQLRDDKPEVPAAQSDASLPSTNL